ncbi:restriction endonuclease subunit S [Pseudorhodoplanes sp.]|uniref:restriction endonuclease subunit S n=1 Tax=Pseudorhodoplanes sp. TaxID=1934341 RepID=UPI003D0B39EE
MKAGWDTKSLGDIAVVSAGNSAPQDKALFVEGKYPFFRTSDVGRIHIGTLTESEDRLNDKGIKRLTSHPAGTILIPKSGASTFLDHRVIMGVDGYVSSHLATVRAKPEVIDANYLFYYLLTVEARSLGVDTAYPTLSLSQLKGIGVSLPPLSEQQRIVAILDEALAGLAKAAANAEKNLKNARELFESYVDAAFQNADGNWRARYLGDDSLLQIIDGDRGANYPKRSDFSASGHCLFLNTKNVRPDGFDFAETMFISEKKDRELRKGKLKRGDVVLTTRGTIGNVAVYDDDVPFEDIRINSGMLIFRPDTQKISPKYLFEIFRSGVMKKQIVKHVSGAAQPQLPIKTLVQFVIPVPDSIKEQQKIIGALADLADQTGQLELRYEDKISNLNELKQSILKKAFSGELTSPPSQAIKEAAE